MARRRRPSPTLNLAPFVDIVFLLVIFFMVTSTFITPEEGLPVDLPSAQSAEQEPTGVPVVVVDARGQVFLGNRRYSDAALFAELKDRLAGKKDRTVVLRADSKVPHGRVVEVMDILRQAGASRVAIAVMP